MAIDNNVTAELQLIASILEDFAGITISADRYKDTEIVSRLRRIREALQPALDLAAPTEGPKYLSFIVQDPENALTVAGRGTQSFLVWLNDTGRTFRIEKIVGASDADDYSFSLFKSASDVDVSTANDVPVKTLVCSTDGTSIFTALETTFDSDTIEDGKWLIWEHTSGAAESVTVFIKGRFE